MPTPRERPGARMLAALGVAVAGLLAATSARAAAPGVSGAGVSDSPASGTDASTMSANGIPGSGVTSGTAPSSTEPSPQATDAQNAPSVSPTRSPTDDLSLASGPCTQVDLTGDEMTCDRGVCQLRGNVSLTCESMRLFASELEVRLGTDGQFEGAIARGHALLVDGARVITCEAITLAPDRVHARIEDATVRVKRRPLRLGPDGVPVGRDQSVFTGALVERVSENRLHIDHATFTLCDCGDAPPSWHLSASSIDARLGDRATVYWPVFWIRPFGLELPLTPPLPPLSIPLRERAAGFLAPRIAFYDPPWPTIDLPFFIPLGPSWDLTLAPGLRTDFTKSHGLEPDEWGAPRLGARLRYAPAIGTKGEWTTDWTHDGQLYANKGLGPEERVSVTGAHRSDLSDELRLLAGVEWVSDDLYRNNFIIGLEQVAAYLPSRIALAWRSPALAASVGAEYLERLDSSSRKTYFDSLAKIPGAQAELEQRLDGIDFLAVSNLSRIELEAPQHGPSLRLQLVPHHLGAGLLAEGEVTLDRFGAFASAPEALGPALFVTRAAPALAYARALGPVALRARAALDAAVLSGDGGIDEPTEALAAVADADASLSLARRFGGWLHLVTPRVSYRAIPWRTGPALGDVTYVENGSATVSELDEVLRRDRVEHQAMLSVDQELYRMLDGATASVARLRIGQPVDLRSGSLLPTRIAATLAPPGWGRASVEADVYLPGIGAPPKPVTTPAGTTVDENRALRDLVASLASPALGPLTFGVAYNRFSPESSRLLRTIYELEAPLGRYAPGATWIHYVTLGAALRLPPRLALTYGTDYYLRYPGEAASDKLPGYTEHRIGLEYHSPCDCWDVRAVVRIPRLVPEGTSPFQMAFFLNVAGFGIGG